MEPLDGYFPEVLLDTEVHQFIIVDPAVVVEVVPKNVFDEVMNFCLILMEDGDQEVPDLILLELLVLVAIELDEAQVDHLPHLEGQLLGGELEAVVLVLPALDHLPRFGPNVSPFLTRHQHQNSIGYRQLGELIVLDLCMT